MRRGTKAATVRGAVRAAALALAALLAPALTFAQGAGGGAGGPTQGGSTGSGGRLFLAWIVVILAIAVVIWLFTRRRGGPASGARP